MRLSSDKKREGLAIRRVSGADDLKRAFELRAAIFIDEQGVSEEAEFDGLDGACHHLLAILDDRVVGTLRIRLMDHKLAKIERVAVAEKARGRHVGANLMAFALRIMPEFDVCTVKLHAQTQAEAFYEKLGFVARGDVFDEDGIPHVAMYLDRP